MNFCTMFDSNYLDRGIALCNSLNSVTEKFSLYIVAFDEKTFEILTDLKIENVHVIPEEAILDKALLEIKMQRRRTEYCWTCTPVIIQYVLKQYNLEECTYIDADMYFYQSPSILLEEINNSGCDVSIISHRFPKNIAEKTSKKQHGNYCVEFNTFFNNTNGNKVLEWWKNKCFESCSMKLYDNSFGDQMYLNEWPRLFDRVYEVKNPGAGVAPWNISDYKMINQTNDGIHLLYKKKVVCELIFYHFQSFKIISEKYADIGVHNSLGKIDERLVDVLYDNYITDLTDIRDFLEKRYSLSIKGAENRKVQNKWRYTGIRDFVVYCILFFKNLRYGSKNLKVIPGKGEAG